MASYQRQKQAAHYPATNKPKTVQDIDEAVQRMDKINRTSFYIWLRDQTHLDQIAMHCKRILKDFQSDEIALGLCWLTQDWSASRTAELLIKMFYHWGMGSDRFALIVRSLLDYHYNKCESSATIKADDILMTLLIGEDPHLTSRFAFLVTKGWSNTKRLEKITLLSRRMDWDLDFCQIFLQTFTTTLYSDHHVAGSTAKDQGSYVAAAVKLVQSQFRSFAYDRNTSVIKTTTEINDFFKSILKVILEDHEKAMSSTTSNGNTTANMETTKKSTNDTRQVLGGFRNIPDISKRPL